jgi:hypothetical protein
VLAAFRARGRRFHSLDAHKNKMDSVGLARFALDQLIEHVRLPKRSCASKESRAWQRSNLRPWRARVPPGLARREPAIVPTPRIPDSGYSRGAAVRRFRPR